MGTKNKGTYKLDGNKIDMTLGSLHTTGKVSDDKKTLKIKVDGINMTYHKNEK